MDVHIRKHIKADEKLTIANIKITCKRLVNSIYKGTSLKILSNSTTRRVKSEAFAVTKYVIEVYDITFD